ncbi:DUF4142 domain-containing protein [Dyella choica]|uniref:DUF4142 domain-containing protein n=1 Tax=Dyella choica TaxID=1927959 RepID=A0A3S0RK96_9GAMM|nr:DUF4142 domain-containing protein [Dyella choica]RUL75230.1 DUF4142 domain-containing protein [Dyella choica]
MRVARFSRFVPVSLILLWMTMATGLAQAADTHQPLNANEQAFLTRAMNDNASQVAMAKLALAKSINPRVIELASSIIQQRNALSARMAQLRPGVDLQAAQVAGGNAMLEHMQALNGDAFDRTFTSSAVRNHCRMISAYEAMKVSSANPALRDFTHDAIPALRGNLTVAMSVLRSSGWTKPQQEALATVDTHSGSKAAVFWEPISLVAAPW